MHKRGTAQTDREQLCLVRASDGARKLATHVRAPDVAAFRAALAAVQRDALAALTSGAPKHAE